MFYFKVRLGKYAKYFDYIPKSENLVLQYWLRVRFWCPRQKVLKNNFEKKKNILTCITIEQYSKKVTNKLLGAEDTGLITGSSVAGVPLMKLLVSFYLIF